MKPQERRKAFETSAEEQLEQADAHVTATGRTMFKDWSQIPKRRPDFHELYGGSHPIREMTRERFQELYEQNFEVDYSAIEQRICEITRGYSKQGMQADYIKGYYPDFVILDECSDLKPPAPVEDLKDWEHKIPDPNPFNRPVSAPSAKTRAKLRAKRKKRK